MSVQENLRDSGVSWPDGARAATVITVDLDAELFWVQLDPVSKERPKTLSLGEYGPNRGIPRLLSVLSDYEVSATFFVPGAVADRYSETLRAIDRAGHEIAAKGYLPSSFVHFDNEEQRDSLRRSIAAIERATGKRPRGFRSFDDIDGSTLEILVEEGFTWTSVLAGDDRPQVQLVDNSGAATLIDIPSLWELNEFRYFGFNYGPAMPAGQNRPASYARVAADWKDEYDAYAEARASFVLTLDPQSIGKPGRISILREVLEHIRNRGDAWFTTAGELADWWRDSSYAKIPEGAAEPIRRRTIRQIDTER